MSSVSGQYVMVTGTCSGWCLFDEIKVLSPSGSVLSTGATYTVVPTPTNGPGSGTTFGDDDYKLTDGAVVPVYGPQFADAVDGIPGNSGGSVQATWTGAHSASSTGVSTATIWMSTPNSTYGVVLPASVTISWRNASGVWQAGHRRHHEGELRPGRLRQPHPAGRRPGHRGQGHLPRWRLVLGLVHGQRSQHPITRPGRRCRPRRSPATSDFVVI